MSAMRRLPLVLAVLALGCSARASLVSDIDNVEARMKVFNELYAKCHARKIPLDYPAVAKTTLEQFIPLAREDAQNGQEKRADYAVRDFNRTLDQSITEMKAYLADHSRLVEAFRKKDPEESGHRMREHIRRVRDGVMENIRFFLDDENIPLSSTKEERESTA